MTPNERRKAIIELLCVRKTETRANLAFEFGVSLRTIAYDIERLSLEYPIYSSTGTNGGISIMDGYRSERKYLSEDQAKLLSSIIPSYSGEDKKILESILKDFSLPASKGEKK